MNPALIISQNAIYIALGIIIFYGLYKVLMMYLDNEKKINKIKQQWKKRLKER